MSWLAVALWGGAVGLDATSFPQVMISRPIVAAAVTGLLLGEPLAGIGVGVILELFALVILPIGAARYPEGGPAAVAAAAAYAGTAGGESRPELLLLAVGFGLVWEHLSGSSVNALRRLNERLVTTGSDSGPLTAGRLERIQYLALAADFLRGSIMSVAGAAIAFLLLRAVGGYWSLGTGPAAGALGVAGAAMVGASLSLFKGWSERRLAFALGVLCGVLVLLAG